MLTRLILRLVTLGSLAGLAAAPVPAQTPPTAGAIVVRELGLGRLSLIVPHPDGGFVAAGRRFSSKAGQFSAQLEHEPHPLVIRLGPDGRVRWERTFADRRRGEPHALQVVPGGGIRLTGYGGLSFDRPGTIRRLDWIAEIDDEGRVTRDDSLDLDRPKHEGVFLPLTPTTFVFYGSAVLETGTQGVDLVATDAQGAVRWRTAMPDVPGECEGAATADAEGGLVTVVGLSPNGTNLEGARFRRFDAAGRLTRDQPVGAVQDTCPMSIRDVPGAGFLVTGRRSDGGGPTGWLALLDRDGAPVWERSFGRPEDGVGVILQGAAAPDGSLVVTGCIDGDGVDGKVLRYDRTGTLTGERRFPSRDGDTPVAVAVGRDGTIGLAGVRGQRCGQVSGADLDKDGEAWAALLPPDSLAPPAR